jgi:hypothetical protein
MSSPSHAARTICAERQIPRSRTLFAGALVASALLGACTGNIPVGGGAGGTGGSLWGGGCPTCPTTCTDCGPGSSAQGVGWSTRFPRLSHKQWENTMRDLLKLDRTSGLSTSFTPDVVTRFDTNAEENEITTNLRNDYETAAETLAKQVVTNSAQLAKIMPPNLTGDTQAKGRAFVTSFGKRAFRRALTAEEVTAMTALFMKGSSLLGGDAVVAGVELSLRAFLQSPHTLYRVESSTAAQQNKIWLNAYEMATRLSYTLWNTMPSDALLAAAEAGELSTMGGVARWASNMVHDPRAQEIAVSFHEQIFGVALYGTTLKDPRLFPTFTRDLEPILQSESRMFFDDVTKNGGGIRDVLTKPFTFVNNRTAGFYGLNNGSFTGAMQRVDLDPQRRAGILTQLGFLAKNGGLVQSDPIHRGVLINLNVLCEKIIPPPNLPPLPELQPAQTNRQRVDNHTKVCGAGCHDTRINPVGFAFEHYDAIGAWRDTDNGLPVDSAATYTLDGQTLTYNDAVQLAQKLAEARRVHNCYATNWLEYALGRKPVVAETESIKLISDASIAGAGAKALLARITTLDTFRARPVEVAP